MTVYNRQIATATRIIKAKGQAATWQKNTEVADNTQPWKTTAGAPQTFPCFIVRLPLDNSMFDVAKAFQTLMPGTSVSGDKEIVLMAGGQAFVPAMNDNVVIAGESKRVASLDVLQPDGTPILYSMTLK